MKNINIIAPLLALVVVGVIVGIVVGKDKTPEQSNALSSSAIVVENDSYDFGDIDIFGGKVSTDYILANTGSEDVVVTNGITSCGCTEGEIAGENFGMHFDISQSVTIPVNSSVHLTAIYDPLAHGPSATGPVTRTIMLKTNSSLTPELEVRFTANVTKDE